MADRFYTFRPVYPVAERVPAHNYSVLALVDWTDIGEKAWEVCSYIDGQWFMFGEAEDGTYGDVPAKVSYWCELPWYPQDGEMPARARRDDPPATMEEALQRIAYLEAQEDLLQEWQDRAEAAEAKATEIRRPLDEQMARLNARVIEQNAEIEQLRRQQFREVTER